MATKITFGGSKKPAPQQSEDAPVSLSGNTTPVAKPTSLKERTSGFKFAVKSTGSADAKAGTQAATTARELPSVEAEPDVAEATQESQAADGFSVAITDESKYIHPTQPDAASSDATIEFKNRLQQLIDSFGEDKEQVGENVRNCMKYLQANPDLRDLLQPEDVQMMVRGMRTTYANVAQTKRGKKTAAAKTNAAVDEVMDLLSNFSI